LTAGRRAVQTTVAFRFASGVHLCRAGKLPPCHRARIAATILRSDNNCKINKPRIWVGNVTYSGFFIALQHIEISRINRTVPSS
jgi:hypothetical protein